MTVEKGIARLERQSREVVGTSPNQPPSNRVETIAVLNLDRLAIMEKLEGGFINNVFWDDGVVIKSFAGDELVGIPASERRFREAKSLVLYGGTLAPMVLGFSQEGNILQEFIQGELLEKKAETSKEINFVELGRLLASIHQPVNGGLNRFRDKMEDRIRSSQQKTRALFEYLGLETQVAIDWQEMERWGLCRIHRDFWMGNIIENQRGLVAIDWEFSGIGSAYEDFAIVDLWIFREYRDKYIGLEDEFWRGYGVKPDEDSIREFLKVRCLEFLATTEIESFELEDENGFYHNKVKLLRELNDQD